MQAPRPCTLPVPREDVPFVEEWDDASCLARAVERLSDERREVRELHGLRRCVTLSSGATLLLLATLTLFAMAATLEPLMAAAMIGLLRGAIVQGIDQDIDQHRRLAAQRQHELAARLERTDWLLQA